MHFFIKYNCGGNQMAAKIVAKDEKTNKTISSMSEEEENSRWHMAVSEAFKTYSVPDGYSKKTFLLCGSEGENAIIKLTNDGGETWRRFKMPVDLATD
jgi:hypothetical protein